MCIASALARVGARVRGSRQGAHRTRWPGRPALAAGARAQRAPPRRRLVRAAHRTRPARRAQRRPRRGPELLVHRTDTVTGARCRTCASADNSSAHWARGHVNRRWAASALVARRVRPPAGRAELLARYRDLKTKVQKPTFM